MHNWLTWVGVDDRHDWLKDTICSTHDPYQAIRSKDLSLFFTTICNILRAVATHSDASILRSGNILWTTTDGQTNHFNPCACMWGNKLNCCLSMCARASIELSRIWNHRYQNTLSQQAHDSSSICGWVLTLRWQDTTKTRRETSTEGALKSLTRYILQYNSNRTVPIERTTNSISSNYTILKKEVRVLHTTKQGIKLTNYFSRNSQKVSYEIGAEYPGIRFIPATVTNWAKGAIVADFHPSWYYSREAIWTQTVAKVG